MAKVLISFLGTGPNNKDKNKAERSYRPATYKFEDGEEKKTSFVADALAHHYNIDNIILIGTPKSMWERVYEVFCDNNNIEADLEYYDILSNACDNASHESPLILPCKEKIEEALGGKSHVVLIHYGLNEEELNKNASIILGIEEFINSGDELYVDITHAFRSLPLYMMNLLIYLKNVSGKKISISNISYGMLDVSAEFDNITPVVDLNGIMQISEWITGAYSFGQFGNGYKIAELLVQQGDLSAANTLTKFTNVLGLNHLDGVKKQVQELSSIRNKNWGEVPNRIIPNVVNSFIANLEKCKTQSSTQFKLSDWYCKHKNYSSAYIALTEAIITYVCEEVELSPITSEEHRKKAKEILHSDKNSLGQKVREYEKVSKAYKVINNIRKCIAHSLETPVSSTNMIKELENQIQILKNIIK